jgi:hypothetical protein
MWPKPAIRDRVAFQDESRIANMKREHEGVEASSR